MEVYTALPLLLFNFWFVKAPEEMMAYFGSLNTAFMQLFSIDVLLRTFFRPIKNEYRKGLVGFSIGMGMFIKTILLLTAGICFLAVLMIEAAIIFLFVAFPIITIIILFL